MSIYPLVTADFLADKLLRFTCRLLKLDFKSIAQAQNLSLFLIITKHRKRIFSTNQHSLLFL